MTRVQNALQPEIIKKSAYPEVSQKQSQQIYHIDQVILLSSKRIFFVETDIQEKNADLKLYAISYSFLACLCLHLKFKSVVTESLKIKYLFS